jgi:YegS/Rv2252/BmrU family lipid kinase
MNRSASLPWMVIVNPNAGYGRGKTDWMIIKDQLGNNAISFDNLFTESPGHAIILVKDSIHKGYRNFIVVGGDGTLNEVVNGVFNQTICPTPEITVAMIPVGTGNDWGRMFHIPHGYNDAIKIIKDGKRILHDVGLATHSTPGREARRYFLNIAGLGFDALVVKRTNHQKELGNHGKTIYLINLLRCLLQYRYLHATITIDENIVSREIFTISVGIGRFSGGGMQQTPNAIPNDGCFDMTIIKKIGKADIIWSLRRLYDGTLLQHPKTENFRGKIISIQSSRELLLEADGELLGQTPVTFTILPQSLGIIYSQLPV